MSKKIYICQSGACRRNGSEKLLEQAIIETKNSSVNVEKCGCLSGCQFGPNAVITDDESKEQEKIYTLDSRYLTQKINQLKESND